LEEDFHILHVIRGTISTSQKDIQRVENSSGIQASLSGRYATALFGLALEQKKLDAVGESLAAVAKALGESADFKALTTNPLVSRADAAKAIAAVAKAMKLDPLTTNFLGVLAQNSRLGQVGPVIAAFNTLTANHRGEATAEVTSAHALDKAQIDALKAQLKKKVGREVAVELKTDPTILGGLIVKIGSEMIDSSIKTRLKTLATVMKG
jgi:F-type H+-transporting ATPase subunit delta